MRWVVGGILVLMVTSCGDVAPDGCRGAASLSPALTSTIVALGAGDDLVGRTPWCATDAPVVGSLLDLDAEALVEAHPCVIVVQPPAQGIDGGLAQVAARLGASIHAWPLATLTDIRTMVRELPAALDPGNRPLAARAEDLLAEMDRACAPMSWDPARTVLIVQAGDGRLAFGPSTYLGEFLAVCTVPNALSAGAWQTLGMEDMVTIRPAVVVTVGSAPSPWTRELALRTGAVIVNADDDSLLVPSGTLGVGLGRVREALLRVGASP
jgi:iron complex transport system substrate-binding protein